MPYLDQLTWEGGVPIATDVAPPGTPPPAPAPGSPDFVGPVDTNPQPGDPNFTGPVQSTTTDGTYTLPIEIFNGVLPPIVIQTGGAPTIPSPIPTTLPTTPAPAPAAGNAGFWVVLVAVGAILFSPSKKKKRR